MKNRIKRIIAAVSAISVIALGGVNVSAASADDVVAAARAAGFLEVYVQQLQNFLLANSFNSNQYDMMIDALANVESYGDEVALRYFGKTLAEMRGEADSDDDGNETDDDKTDNKKDDNKTDSGLKQPSSDSWAAQVAEKMTNEDIIKSLDEIISTGKKLGLDITVEQTGDKSFTMTVKDKDGNVKLVAPIGKIVSTTGVEAEDNENRFASVAALCASILAAGGIGAWLLGKKNGKIGE